MKSKLSKKHSYGMLDFSRKSDQINYSNSHGISLAAQKIYQSNKMISVGNRKGTSPNPDPFHSLTQSTQNYSYDSGKNPFKIMNG